MATLIGAVLVLVLLYYAHRAIPLLDDDRTRPPLPGRLAHDRSRDGLADMGPETPAEARERELSHQLISGRIDPAAYRQEMAELARGDQSRTGNPR